MTAALAIRESTPLVEWARTFRETAEICTVLARTPFVPASLRVIDHGDLDEEATAAQVTAAILCGQELGLPPISALRSIVVINGTPALSAMVMRALLQERGHRIWLHESTATRAIVRGSRRDDDEHVQQSAWTLDRARTMGLANKPNWRAQPTAMLVARATAECCRLVAADVLLGVPYASEELEDGMTVTLAPPSPPTEEAGDEPEAPPKRRRARRAPMPIEDVQLPSDEPQAPPTPVGDDREGSSSSEALDKPDSTSPRLDPKSPKSKALHAAFHGLSIDDRDDRIAMTSQIIGRTITSSTELTEAEATAVLDELSLLTARRTEEWQPPNDDPFDEQ